MNELVSVIVPIYNVEKFLPKCVESIINQSYKNLEIILVNDGSTDSSADICEHYKKIDERIIVIHKKYGGVSEARNVGIDNAKGLFYVFVDSDDYIEKSMIKTSMSYLLDNNVDLVEFNYNFLNEHYEFIKTKNSNMKMQNMLLSGLECIENICSENRIISSNVWNKPELFMNI